MKKKTSENQNMQSTEQYINSVHRLGRIGGVIAIIIMIAMPVITGLYFDLMPTISQILSGSASLLLIMVPAAVSEVISYTPILGSSIYLTLVTGNVTNLKVPVANNAMKLLDIQSGSEDADVISNIAVSVSSFFTIIIIAAGVLLMVPLQPILELPAVQTASKYILPALFGSMALGIFSDNIGGGIKVPGRMKGAIPAIIIILAFTLLDKFVLKTGIISSMTGIFLLLMLPVTYFTTKMLYQKGKIQVLLPGEGEDNN